MSQEVVKHNLHTFKKTIPQFDLQCGPQADADCKDECSFLTREDCQVVVKNATKLTASQVLSFQVTPIEAASGYLGNYHRLKITLSDKTINCFIKRMPIGATSKQLVEKSGCFAKESFVYQTLLPQLHNLGLKMIDDCVPRCYFHRPEDFLIFEDLSMENYRLVSVFQSFDFRELTLAVKKLAKFHAATLIFEEEMSRRSNNEYRLDKHYKKYLEEVFFLKKDDHLGSKLFQVGLKSIVDVVDLFPDLKTEQNQKLFKDSWEHLEERFFEAPKASSRFRNVLSHGDLWTNNIMMRFDNDNRVVDCRFVDFQCIRYCPPAHDFLSVLHLTTDRVTRIRHGKQLGKIYHDELKQILNEHSYDVDQIHSFPDFLDSVEYIKPQMVMQAIMYRSFMCAPEDIASLLADDDVSKRVFFEDRRDYLIGLSKRSQEWKTKIRDCVLDLYDLCSSRFV